MAKLDAFWVRGSEGGEWEERVKYLSAGNNDILAPILDTYRPVGIHDSQVTAMEVSALESFLGRLLVCEIL